MEAIHTFFKAFLPKYLRSLPIPKTFGGFASLSAEQITSLLPLVGVLLLFMLSLTRLITRRRTKPNQKVNPNIQKEDPKVVTQMEIEDIGDKIAFCRCWRSKKFPLCDGSHNQHNSTNRDNVGPLLLRRRGDDEK